MSQNYKNYYGDKFSNLIIFVIFGFYQKKFLWVINHIKNNSEKKFFYSVTKNDKKIEILSKNHNFNEFFSKITHF